jgi:hypothetical protein
MTATFVTLLRVQSQHPLSVVPIHLDACPITLSIVEGNPVILIEDERGIPSGIKQEVHQADLIFHQRIVSPAQDAELNPPVHTMA